MQNTERANELTFHFSYMHFLPCCLIKLHIFLYQCVSVRFFATAFFYGIFIFSMYSSKIHLHFCNEWKCIFSRLFAIGSEEAYNSSSDIASVFCWCCFIRSFSHSLVFTCITYISNSYHPNRPEKQENYFSFEWYSFHLFYAWQM